MVSLNDPFKIDMEQKLQRILHLVGDVKSRHWQNSEKANGKWKRPQTFGDNPSQRTYFGRTKSKMTTKGQPVEEKLMNCRNNSEYPELFEALWDVIKFRDPDFRFTTVVINASSSKCIWHYDKNNKGDSYGVSIGAFRIPPHPKTKQIGDLWTSTDEALKKDDDYNNVECVNYYNNPTKFNGKTQHRTNPLIEYGVGEHRIAIIYFTVDCATYNDRHLSTEYLKKIDSVGQEAWLYKYRNDNFEDIREKINIPKYDEVLATRKTKSEHVIPSPKTKTIKWKHCNLQVISLKRCKGRRKHMKEHLQKNGFSNFGFYDACDRTNKDFTNLFLTKDKDGKTTVDRNKFKYMAGVKDYNRVLGKICCATSHFWLWYKALEENWPNLLVMEDDINFDHNIFNEDELCVPPAEFIQIGWHYCGHTHSGKYYAEKKEKWEPFCRELGGKKGNVVKYPIWQTHCYLLPNRRAIKRLISLYKPFLPNPHGTIETREKSSFNWGIDAVFTKYIFLKMKTFLLRKAVKQMPAKGPIFKSEIDIDSSPKKKAPARNFGPSKANNRWGSTRDAPVNSRTSSDWETSSNGWNKDGPSTITGMTENLQINNGVEESKVGSPILVQETNTIYIAYIAKPKQKGGWRSFVVHLYYCLKQMKGVIPIVVRVTKTGIIQAGGTDFGYGIKCIGLTTDELSTKKNVILAACNYKILLDLHNNENELKKFYGQCIVVHDPNEWTEHKKVNEKYIKHLRYMKVIVIRKSVQMYLKSLNVVSVFLRHPFYKFPLVKKEKTEVISTSRVINRKRTKMICEANALEEVDQGIAADFIKIRAALSDERYLQRWKDSKEKVLNKLIPERVSDGTDYLKFDEDGIDESDSDTENYLQDIFDKCYEGAFDMTFEATAETYSDAIAVVDLSKFNGDGGGTQYSFLEAIHCGCLLIIHQDWLNYPGPFVDGYNCVAVSDAEDLWQTVTDLDIDVDNIISNAEKLLEQHNNGWAWAGLIVAVDTSELGLQGFTVVPPPPPKLKEGANYIKDVYELKPNNGYTGKAWGWLGIGNQRFLKKKVQDKNIKCIVELGSWYGRSARFMMEQGHEKLYLICVDTWNEKDILEGKQSSIGRDTENGRIEKEIVRKYPMLPTFCSNLWNYRDRVVVFKMTTVEALQEIHKKFDDKIIQLIYIDADHTYKNVVEEIELSLKLFPNAEICGDDYNQQGVKRAVIEMAKKHNLYFDETNKVGGTHDKNFWRLESHKQKDERIVEDLQEEIEVKQFLTEVDNNYDSPSGVVNFRDNLWENGERIKTPDDKTDSEYLPPCVPAKADKKLAPKAEEKLSPPKLVKAEEKSSPKAEEKLAPEDSKQRCVPAKAEEKLSPETEVKIPEDIFDEYGWYNCYNPVSENAIGEDDTWFGCGHTYVNPPPSERETWLKKCDEEFQIAKNDNWFSKIDLVLPFSAQLTDEFHLYVCNKAHIRYVKEHALLICTYFNPRPPRSESYDESADETDEESYSSQNIELIITDVDTDVDTEYEPTDEEMEYSPIERSTSIKRSLRSYKNKS